MCDPVGVADIATRLDVRRQTVAVWKVRGLLPEPTWPRQAGPLWDWPTIETWAKETGRVTTGQGLNAPLPD
jgi:hypothetical protein